MTTDTLKHDVAAYMQRLYRRRLTTALGGNVSLRVSEDRVLITPSGQDKESIRAEQIGEMRLDGTNLTTDLKPSMEAPLHLAVYRARPDVLAIAHAHPVTASTFAASERKINCRLLAESRLFLGEVPHAPYACMGTHALADSVVKALGNRHAVLMANHGALTVGGSLLEAFDRMEVLEAAARVTLMSRLLGAEKELNRAQLAEIDCLFD